MNSKISILKQLKDTTRPYHEKLESRVDLLNKIVTLPTYRTLLSQFYGFYRPVEPLLLQHEGWATAGFEIEQRSKLPALETDLRVLGLTAQDLQCVPVCTNLPEVASFAQVLGCMYVLEGATLGGQIISRHLQRTLDLDASCGGAFFGSYGQEVGPMWQAFGSFVTAQAKTAEVEQEMIEAACATFRKFDAWLASDKTYPVV